ncbi:laterosporulin family class IId bacteriocin [Paenibacillus alba]|uniref:laterosporulin family class IId bacteriocin n=1 Tax=Paenibacillus alba TaxID=1197127 RepID=UPI001564994F|nr:laterosporulin family class IId bacteriocin [Paenibacillus alba]
MACQTTCPDGVKEWVYDPAEGYICHLDRKQWYRHQYQVCNSGSNQYCKTEFKGSC